MKKTILALAVLFLATTATVVQAADFPEGSPKFTKEYAEVMKAAKENGKPAAIVFSATWCGLCQTMKKEVYPSAAVKPFHDKFNWSYLDITIDANNKLSEELKIENVPSILFLSADGKAIGLQDAYADANDTAKKLAEVLKKAEKAGKK
ncbi:MAG: thioredoxin family protein [Prosthecobacter sp.]